MHILVYRAHKYIAMDEHSLIPDSVVVCEVLIS